MSRVQEIIQGARDSLADPHQERWTDARLLRLLNEGQKTIARYYELLRADFSVLVSPSTAVYTLPTDLWLITRCTFKGVALPLRTFDMMDNHSPTWSADVGPEVSAIVYDNRNLQELRIYPLPGDDFPIEDYKLNSPYGVTVSIDDKVGDLYGVLTSASGGLNDTVALSSPYGVTTAGSYLELLAIDYVRDAKDLYSLTDSLEIPPMFDRALKFYVIGYAFGDDLDTQYQEKSQLALATYERESALLGTRAKQSDGVRSGKTTVPNYKGFM